LESGVSPGCWWGCGWPQGCCPPPRQRRRTASSGPLRAKTLMRTPTGSLQHLPQQIPRPAHSEGSLSTSMPRSVTNALALLFAWLLLLVICHGISSLSPLCSTAKNSQAPTAPSGMEEEGDESKSAPRGTKPEIKPQGFRLSLTILVFCCPVFMITG